MSSAVQIVLIIAIAFVALCVTAGFAPNLKK